MDVTRDRETNHDAYINDEKRKDASLEEVHEEDVLVVKGRGGMVIVMRFNPTRLTVKGQDVDDLRVGHVWRIRGKSRFHHSGPVPPSETRRVNTHGEWHLSGNSPSSPDSLGVTSSFISLNVTVDLPKEPSNPLHVICGPEPLVHIESAKRLGFCLFEPTLLFPKPSL